MRISSLILSAIALSGALFADSISLQETTDWTGTTGLMKQIAPGTFSINGNGAFISKSRVSIQPEKKYEIRGEFGNPSGKINKDVYFGVVCYDKDGKVISPEQVNAVPGSDTWLIEGCTYTDQKIKIKDGGSWKVSQNHCAAFETNKDRSDLPNRKTTRPGIREIKKISDGIWEVTFSREIGFEYPAQTAVREHAAGATYLYFFAGKLPADGKAVSLPLQSNSLRPGTASVSIIVILAGDKNTPVTMKDISILEK